MLIASLLLLAAGIALAVPALRRARTAESEHARIRTLFARYLSPAVVDELLARKDARALEGRSLTATILYARLWNFTLKQERLAPEELLRYLNE
ncbi:adenylate/guanylate cyclase domain-containing protein, partial [bacterium]